MSTPTNLLFSTTDEWVKVEGNIATIGISDYAQNSLSDIVYVEFKVSVGETIKKDTTCVGVESVKAAADVNSPISGKVIEVNEGLVRFICGYQRRSIRHSLDGKDRNIQSSRAKLSNGFSGIR